MNFAQADLLNETIRAVGVRHRAMAIAALAPLGIHPGHKLLLMHLAADGPCTQAELAAATGYRQPTITLSVRQLQAAGLVVRRPSISDQRANMVELSDAGRALIPQLKTAWRRLAEQSVAGLTATSAALLGEVLADLADSLADADAVTHVQAPPQTAARAVRAP